MLWHIVTAQHDRYRPPFCVTTNTYAATVSLASAGRKQLGQGGHAHGQAHSVSEDQETGSLSLVEVTRNAVVVVDVHNSQAAQEALSCVGNGAKMPFVFQCICPAEADGFVSFNVADLGAFRNSKESPCIADRTQE